MGSIPFGLFLQNYSKKDIRMLLVSYKCFKNWKQICWIWNLIFRCFKSIITLVIIKLHYSEYIYISALSIFRPQRWKGSYAWVFYFVFILLLLGL